MHKKRKTAANLKPGDRVLVPVTLCLEVASASREGEDQANVNLSVKSVSCGDDCPEACDCESNLLADSEQLHHLTLAAKRKVVFLGNLAEDMALLQALQSRLGQLPDSPDNNSNAFAQEGVN